jgi:hypothetical protein
MVAAKDRSSTTGEGLGPSAVIWGEPGGPCWACTWQQEEEREQTEGNLRWGLRCDSHTLLGQFSFTGSATCLISQATFFGSG